MSSLSPTFPDANNAARHHGFTLVEVMVAMVIGLIGILIVLQVFSTAESQKQSTTGSGDAQNNGAIALHSLQRDARQAGYGINSLNVMGCPLTLPAPASRQLTNLAPLTINPPVADVPAGDDNTDTLLVFYGNSPSPPEGDRVTTVASVGTSQQIGIMSPSGFLAGNHVIAAPAAPTTGCALTMAAITAVSAPNVTAPDIDAVEGGSLFNIGATPRILAYAVRGGNLTVCDYMQANCGTACEADNPNCNDNWTPIANNVVSLRAQYGRDTSTPMDGIDTWDQTTPTQPNPANQETFACRWARISAIRLAIVARNKHRAGLVTQNAPVWEGSDNIPINLTALDNWQNYRYQVFETVVPLRNLPWMAACS